MSIDLFYCKMDINGLDEVAIAGSSNALVAIEVGMNSVERLLGWLQVHYPGCPVKYNSTYGTDFFRQLDLYLKGKLTVISYSYMLKVTPFQEKVLKEIEKIPFGKTRTYSDIARGINSPGAARAVGMACRTNPLPLLIPCHRVVSANGIGGYTPGIEYKRFLFEVEKI